MKHPVPLSCGLIICLTLLAPLSAPAATIHVPDDQPTIQAGIDAAVDGDTVLVADGSYTGGGNREVTFNGKAITVRSAGGAAACIIDCQGYRGFVFENDEGPDAVMQGFTIKNCHCISDSGGAIKVQNCSPTILDNILINNSADYSIIGYGGGALYYNGSGLVAGNRFLGNLANTGGGAWLRGGVLFRDNLVNGNTAFDTGGGLEIGGATVDGCTVTDNWAGFLAAGIHAANIVVSNSVIWGNESDGVGEDLYLGGSANLSWSDIDKLYAEPGALVEYGPGLINADPLFVDGPQGPWYLSQVAAGQAAESPCADAGNPASELHHGTTRTDSVPDSNIIDLGYHYPTGNPWVVAAPGAGPANPPLVKVYSVDLLIVPVLQYEFTAYGATGYGVNLACGNLAGDRFDEILTGPGPGAVYGPHVRGFTVDGTPLPGLSFFAYGTLKYGVNVAAGDIDNDGFDEIVTGAGPGAVFGSHVRAFDYDGGPAVTAVPGVSYFAYGTPKWGVNVCCGDIDGDGYDEIITGAGPGAHFGPHVRGWNVDGGSVTAIPNLSFFAFETAKHGVNVACGDLDGDGMAELVTGPGPDPLVIPWVKGWNYDGTAVTELPNFSFPLALAYFWHFGANVYSGTDLDGDGRDDLLAGPGPDPEANQQIYIYSYRDGDMTLWFLYDGYATDQLYGTEIAAGRF